MDHTPGTNNLSLAEIRDVRGDRVALNFSAQDSPIFSWRCNEAYTGVPATDDVVTDYGTNTLPGVAENGANRISASGRRAGEGARLFQGATARIRLPYNALLNFVTPGALVLEMWLKRSVADTNYARNGYAMLLTNDPTETLADGRFTWVIFPDGRTQFTWGTPSGVQSVEQIPLLDSVARRVSGVGVLGRWYHLGVHWTLGAQPKLLLNSVPTLSRVVRGTGLVAPTTTPVADWMVGDPSATGTRGLAGSLVNGVRMFTSTVTRTLAKIENYNRGVGL
jgi:hypothetical protein